MKKDAKWAVYLQPNWNYDVTVTMGSQDISTYNLKVIGNSGTYTLARSFSLHFSFFFPTFSPFEFLFFENSNLVLGINQYVDKTQRIKTGSDGKVVLQEVFFVA